MIHSFQQKVKKKGTRNEFDEKAFCNSSHCHSSRCSFRAAGCPRWLESAAGRYAVRRKCSVKKTKSKGRLKWVLIYTAAFLAAFVGSALFKINSDPTHGKYTVQWSDAVGKVYTDLPYGMVRPTNLTCMFRRTTPKRAMVLWFISTLAALRAAINRTMPRCWNGCAVRVM